MLILSVPVWSLSGHLHPWCPDRCLRQAIHPQGSVFYLPLLPVCLSYPSSHLVLIFWGHKSKSDLLPSSQPFIIWRLFHYHEVHSITQGPSSLVYVMLKQPWTLYLSWLRLPQKYHRLGGLSRNVFSVETEVQGQGVGRSSIFQGLSLGMHPGHFLAVSI